MDVPAVNTSQSGSVCVVAPTGDHDLSTAPELTTALAAAEGAVVVDLTGATFIDSSILGVILNAKSRTEEGGHAFVCVVNPVAAPSVARIFDLTGLTATFVIADSRDRALELVEA